MNIKDYFKTRPLSWSAISSFDYSPAEWYSKYILNKKEKPNPEMIFGKKFADSCEARKPLAPVTLLSKMEQPFNFVFNGIPMVGYADTFDDVTKKELGEYKTSKTIWTQSKVDSHGQLTLYAMANFITNKIRPEDCKIFLECVQTRQTGDYKIEFMQPIKVHHFETKRTMQDVIEFGMRINKIVTEMQEYCNENDRGV